MSKILLTGCSGLCGQELTNRLIGSDAVFTDLHAVTKQNHKIYHMDVTNLKLVKSFLSAEKPDVIVHLAGLVGGKDSNKNPYDFIKVNTMGTVNILEAMRLADVTNLIFASSWSTYGTLKEDRLPITEWTHQHPETVYAISKIMAEYAVRNYAEQYGFKVAIPRFTAVYGENQKEKYIINDLTDCMVSGETYEIWGEGCYSGDTEVLTEKGFIVIEDIVEQKLNVKIATLDSDGKLIFRYPTKFWKIKSEKMIHFNGRKIDLLVTPQHRMWVRRKKHNQRQDRFPSHIGFEFVQAQDIPYTAEFKRDFIWEGKQQTHFDLPECKYSISNVFKKGSGFTGQMRNRGKIAKILPIKKIVMDDWLRFFGIWLAEGCTVKNSEKESGYVVGIAQTKQENLEIIKKIIEGCGFKTWYSGHSFLMKNKQLWSYLRQFGKSHQKFIPRWIFELSKRQLHLLLEMYCLGDGTKNNRSGWTCSTTSRQLADDIQEIALRCGYVVTITPCSSIYKEKICKPIWSISISQNQKTPQLLFHKHNKKTIDYNDYAYCVTVPNHLLYVRRNGKAYWCGNSHTREFLHVSDAVDAIMKLIDYVPSMEYPWEHFIVGTGQPQTILHVARVAQSIAPFEIKFVPSTKFVFNQRSNITYVKNKLGWEPKVSLKEGLTRCYNAKKSLVSMC